MSHRPEDNYDYVATQDINVGTVRAFSEGDPIPASTVEELGYVDAGLAVRRDEWKDRPEDEPERPMVRGEMPGIKAETPTEKSVKTGGSSRKTPAVKTETRES